MGMGTIGTHLAGTQSSPEVPELQWTAGVHFTVRPALCIEPESGDVQHPWRFVSIGPESTPINQCPMRISIDRPLREQ
ncbi:hypothetical protein EMCRGX_G003081 [Ephydatia muelleri]